MKVRTLALVSLVGVAAAACNQAQASGPEVTAYVTPTCSCCAGWVEHMQDSGFTVNVVYQDDLTAIKDEHGVPRELRSCHLGVVDGYAIEGHVPADVVTRLLSERPEVVGLAVPGMPMGAPGMEMPGGRVDPYEVYTFDRTGPQAVYEMRQ